MLMDFGRSFPLLLPVSIEGENVEVVAIAGAKRTLGKLMAIMDSGRSMCSGRSLSLPCSTDRLRQPTPKRLDYPPASIGYSSPITQLCIALNPKTMYVVFILASVGKFLGLHI